MRNRSKYIISLLTLFLLAGIPAFAGEPKPEPIFNNTLAVALFSLMILLLIVIGVLASILLGAAGLKVAERKKANGSLPAAITLLFLLISPAIFAQQDTTKEAVSTAVTYGGLSASTFYVMITILFLELLVVLVLLMNIRMLIKKEKQRALTPEAKAIEAEEKKNRLTWWDRFNNLRPRSQEAELDLGHEYDGIRELNNRLPPWWLYGFYLTILFAAIYLWRFHVSHNGPSSKEEYEHSVVAANLRIQEYLKKKGESVDENTVKLLTSAEDLAAGKAIFMDPSKCPACHRADGGGSIGPNLTDDYWLYGGNIKDLFKTIKYGTNKGMRSWKDDLSPKQIAQVASYVKSLRGTKPANAKEQQGELYQEVAETKPVADTLNKK